MSYIERYTIDARVVYPLAHVTCYIYTKAAYLSFLAWHGIELLPS